MSECRHDVSWIISPPDAEGWQQEVCSWCGRTTDWLRAD